MDEITKKRLSELSQMQKNRNATYLEWLKSILTISTALLAVIISLKSEKSNNLIHSFFYLSTVLLSGIGILFGSLVLFSYVQLENLALKEKREQLIRSLDGKYVDKFVQIELPKFYIIFEYVCYISLFLSLISLLIYGVLIEI